MPTETTRITAEYPVSGAKAVRTRDRILEHAQHEASLYGIDALTIGGLAKLCGLSKSGLNAHFGSKEALQLAVIDGVADRFRDEVGKPALSIPPGRAQLDAIMELWVRWSDHPDRPGGCQLIAASFDFDAQAGAVRDRVAMWLKTWRDAICKAVVAANKADGTKFDPEQIASLAFGLYMSQHVERLLLQDGNATQRALTLWNATLRKGSSIEGAERHQPKACLK